MGARVREDPALEVHQLPAREGDTCRAAYSVALRTVLGHVLDDDAQDAQRGSAGTMGIHCPDARGWTRIGAAAAIVIPLGIFGLVTVIGQ